MAQKSGGKRSKLGLGRHHPWSLESLLHFAIFQGSWQQRLHFKKLISYKRHTDTSRLPRLKVPRVQHFFVKEGTKLQAGENKLGSPGKSPTKSPAKSHYKDLLKPLKFKKKSNEKGHHRKSMSSLPPPLTSRLVRTVSMHHLNGSKYVSPNDPRTTNDGVSHSVGAPSGSSFLRCSQNEPQNICQQCGSGPGYNLVDQINQSKDLLDFLQFFKENKNLLMNIARNPHLLLASESLEKPASYSDQGIGLNKSNSFPRPGVPISKEGTASTPYLQHSTTDNSKTIRSNFKKAIKENKKEVAHIANDGFLHKVPYGQKDCEGYRRNYRKEGGEARMRRSASLVESLDRYSNLFEFISKEEPKHTDCRAGSPEKRSDSAFKRIHSSPEMKTYSAFIPPPSVITSSRSATDMTSMHISAEAENEPLDEESGTSEVEAVGLPSCADEEVEQLDRQFSTSKVEKLDPDDELDDHECIQSNMEEKRYYNSPFSDDTSVVSLDPTKLDVVDDDDYKYKIEVDESDEEAAYFLYMKDVILAKLSGSGLTGPSGEWCSPEQEQPVLDPAAFLELEPDSGSDQLLLFDDLINEALLDAYEPSLLSCMRVPRCGNAIPRLHMGDCMIHQVWARLRRQLNSFAEVATEDVVAADLCKTNDRWMNLNLDSELVVLDLEDWIIEDFVDEIVLELGQSQIHPFF